MKQLHILENQISEVCREQERILNKYYGKVTAIDDIAKFRDLIKKNPEEFVRGFGELDEMTDACFRRGPLATGKIDQTWLNAQENIQKSFNPMTITPEVAELQKNLGTQIASMQTIAARKLVVKMKQYKKQLPKGDEKAEFAAGMMAMQSQVGREFLSLYGDGLRNIMKTSDAVGKAYAEYFSQNKEDQKVFTEAIILYEKTINNPHLESGWQKVNNRFYDRIIEKDVHYIENQELSMEKLLQECEKGLPYTDSHQLFLDYLSARESYIAINGSDAKVLEFEKKYPQVFAKQQEVKPANFQYQVDIMNEVMNSLEGQLYNYIDQAPQAVTDKEEYAYEMIKYSAIYAEFEKNLKFIERTASPENILYAKNHISTGAFSIKRLRETTIKPENEELPEIKEQQQRYLERVKVEAAKYEKILQP